MRLRVHLASLVGRNNVNGPVNQKKGPYKRGKSALEGSTRFSFLKSAKFH